MFTHLYAKQLGLLVEAKGSITRENVCTAIGQLADCSRFVAHESQGCVRSFWPESKGYGSTNPSIILLRHRATSSVRGPFVDR